jgi:hypothetical protein
MKQIAETSKTGTNRVPGNNIVFLTWIKARKSSIAILEKVAVFLVVDWKHLDVNLVSCFFFG